jgi:hypothetical protein
MHGSDLRLNHRGRAVWNGPEVAWEQIQDRRAPYTIFRFETARGEP